MPRLVYAAITSLDGFVADEDGNWDWSEPDHEVHAFVNDLERPIGTYLYGRRMYEVMVAWETMDDQDPVMRDYAELWRAAEKVVFSRTIQAAASERTRIEREFDPAAIRQMKESSTTDISIGGPALAAEAIRAGLVDDVHMFVSPVVVGGGNPALPGNVRLALDLAGERRFGNGVVHLHYRVSSQPPPGSGGA